MFTYRYCTLDNIIINEMNKILNVNCNKNKMSNVKTISNLYKNHSYLN